MCNGEFTLCAMADIWHNDIRYRNMLSADSNEIFFSEKQIFLLNIEHRMWAIHNNRYYLDEWSFKISMSHVFPTSNKYRKLFWNNRTMLDIVRRYAIARHIIYLCLAHRWNIYSLLKLFASPDCKVSRTCWRNMLTNGNNCNRVSYMIEAKWILCLKMAVSIISLL